MLSVGREFNIKEKSIVCHRCGWEGSGATLASGLTRVGRSSIYAYAYRCPQCGSFDVVCKGKVLAFPTTAGGEEPAAERKGGLVRK